MKTTVWIFVLLLVALGLYSIVQTPFLQESWKQTPVQQQPDRTTVIATISAEDKGPLQECTVDNTTYFFARGSIFDGSDNIYDNYGNQVAQCGGGWGVKPDPYPALCTQMYTASCTDINQQ